MNRWINRPVPDLGAGRVLTEEIITLPVSRGPNWPGNKTTTAVRAHVLKNVINTGRAERALIGTYARFKGVGRQRLVAVLAGRSEFKHAGLFQQLPTLRMKGRALRARRLPGARVSLPSAAFKERISTASRFCE